jgi:hypothetical protein
VFHTELEKVEELMKQWDTDVRLHRHFPVCKTCRMRGGRTNPILENMVCLICNARAKGWPLDKWRENGQLVALFYKWGLIPANQVSESIRKAVEEEQKDGYM